MTRALVLGGAACIWNDVNDLQALTGRVWDGLVIAVNNVGAYYGQRIDHWVTLHPEKMHHWTPLRAERGLNVDYTTWAHQQHNGYPVGRVLGQKGAGSSGMLATRVALHLGADRIVLCGIPMEATPHFVDAPQDAISDSKPWTDVRRYWEAWVKHKADFTNVRSMSGRTRELLGAPTREWLRGDEREEAA